MVYSPQLFHAFIRAYHAQKHGHIAARDTVAKKLLSPIEYTGMEQALAEGFGQTPTSSLCVIDHILAPVLLGREAFSESALKTATQIGARQYILLGGGYDTFSLRQPLWASPLTIFEVDSAILIEDKFRRIERAGLPLTANTQYLSGDFSHPEWSTSLTTNNAFHPVISFCNLMGLSYSLSQETFMRLLSDLSALLIKGSTVIFDYSAPASSATKEYCSLENQLFHRQFLLYEHLDSQQITQRFFSNAHTFYPRPVPAHTCYCLAVRQ